MNFRLADTGTANVRRQWGLLGCTMPTITDGVYFQLNGTTFSIVTLKGTSATVINSGSFNGHLGYAYALDTNNHTYQIQYNNAKVQFIIDGKLSIV